MFRAKLRYLREKAGYTSQQSFAKSFGVAQSTVAGWEGGKREPNYETTIRLADFFGVSIDYLLGHEQEVASHPSAPSIDLSFEEIQLVELFRKASPDDRAVIDTVLRKYKAPSSARKAI